MVNAPASQISMACGLRGPAFVVASACASATHAIGLAFHMVRSGSVPVAVTGGAEACIAFGTMKGWEAKLPERIKLSPLVLAAGVEFGAANRFVHIWAYKSMDQRLAVREQ